MRLIQSKKFKENFIFKNVTLKVNIFRLYFLYFLVSSADMEFKTQIKKKNENNDLENF